MVRLVQGVGINDRSCPAWSNGKHNKEYSLWVSMLTRCYSKKSHIAHPTYVKCSVSENFKYYAYFFNWANTQVGFGNVDFQLDKDLIMKGNEIYSEDTCVFIPTELNLLIIKRTNGRGALPLGVTKNGLRYKSRCNVQGKEKHLGTFDTPELAFAAYKTFKEAHIKELAEKYKGTIDPRAYQALLNYEVSIDD